MSKYKIKVDRIRILMVFALLPIYIGSAYLDWIPFIQYLRILGYAIGLISFGYFFLHNIKRKLSEITIILSLMFIYILLLTIYKQADIQGIIRQIFFMVYELLLFDYCRNRIDDLLISIEQFLGILIIINLLSMILFPDGLSKVIVPEGGFSILYFLGHDNSLILYIMPCFIISEYFILKEKKIIRIWGQRMFQAVLIASIVYAKVGMSIVWIVSTVIVYRILLNKLVDKRVNTIVLIVIPIVLNIVMVLLQRQIDVVSYLAQSILGKSATFTGRTYVWENSLKLIVGQSVLGHGYFGNSLMPNLLGYQQAHNLVLQLLIIGGIILLVYYIFVIYKLVKKTFTSSNRLSAFCRAVIVGYLIYTVGEAQFNYKMLIFIPIIWHILDSSTTEKICTPIRSR